MSALGQQTAASRAPDAPKPDYRTWSAVWMVFLGGAIGTLARESLDLITPTHNLPHTTFIINVVGSFALAVIYSLVQLRAETPPAQRRLRLLLGTGFMGGFTTYSSFSVAVATETASGSVADAALLAVASIVIATIAAMTGRCLVETFVTGPASGSKR
jgi:CrcB protein